MHIQQVGTALWLIKWYEITRLSFQSESQRQLHWKQIAWKFSGCTLPSSPCVCKVLLILFPLLLLIKQEQSFLMFTILLKVLIWWWPRNDCQYSLFLSLFEGAVILPFQKMFGKSYFLSFIAIFFLNHIQRSRSHVMSFKRILKDTCCCFPTYSPCSFFTSLRFKVTMQEKEWREYVGKWEQMLHLFAPQKQMHS